MTLSIAAKYPWGSLRKFTKIQNNLPHGIIFLTDSRWTRYYPNNQLEFQDVGTKLFSLTDDSGVVYAGDVISAEHCIKELTKKLREGKKRSFKHSMYMAQQTFQDIYHYHKRKRQTRVFPLWFLIGVCDKEGNASLMSYSSPKFPPIFLEGAYGVGEKEAFKRVEMKINNEVEKLVNDEFDSRTQFPDQKLIRGIPVQNDIGRIALLIASIFKTWVIDADLHPTIGGLMQSSIITSKGFKPIEISWTKDPTGVTDIWHRETALPSEKTTYQSKYKLSKGFISSSSFGLYRIST